MIWSMPCSANKSSLVPFNVRPITKGVFALVFIITMIFVGISTNTDELKSINFSLIKSSTIIQNCTDICSNKDTGEFCNDRWKYLPENQHLVIQIILWILL